MRAMCKRVVSYVIHLHSVGTTIEDGGDIMQICIKKAN